MQTVRKRSASSGSRYALVLIALVSFAIAGCGGSESPSEPVQAASQSGDGPATSGLEIVIESMVGEASLSADQREAISALAADNPAKASEPGAAWQLAAELRDILTDEQIAAIDRSLESAFNERRERRASRGDRTRGRSSARSGVENREGEPPELDRSRMRAHRDEVHEAMVEALGLTDEQSAALQDLWSAGPEGRPDQDWRTSVREAMASILTEDQLQVVTLHRVVAGHRVRAGARSRHGHRADRKVRDAGGS
jgi:hypothetical protein